MAVTTKHLTYDDLKRIPQAHPGDRHEVIDGALAVTASPAWDHQTISSPAAGCISPVRGHLDAHLVGAWTRAMPPSEFNCQIAE